MWSMRFTYEIHSQLSPQRHAKELAAFSVFTRRESEAETHCSWD